MQAAGGPAAPRAEAVPGWLVEAGAADRPTDAHRPTDRPCLLLPLPRPATDGLGAAFGILAACGVKIPKVNSIQWEFAVTLNKLLQVRPAG